MHFKARGGNNRDPGEESKQAAKKKVAGMGEP